MEDTQLAASYLDVRQIAILASLLIPLAVSFLTKQTASDGVKAAVNIAGSALVSALAIWINPSGQEVTVWLFINTFLAALISSFVAYKAIWKPTGVSAMVADVKPEFGLGTSAPESVDDDGDEENPAYGDDIGTFEDLDGDGIPDDLDPGNLDELVASTPTEPEVTK
jgi:hypothetical protein